MPRPKITVTIKASPTRRGSPTSTGSAIWAFTAAGATGTAEPLRTVSADDVTAAYGTADPVKEIAAWVNDAVAKGVPEVILVRVSPAAATATKDEWTAALAKINARDYPATATVAIPGQTTTAAHDALAAHAQAFPGRSVLMDGVKDATADALVTAADPYTTKAGAERIGWIAPWVTMPGIASSTRDVPGSVLVSGLVARGDARVGHTNNAPALDQLGAAAGAITDAIAPTAVYTEAELDSLYTKGITVIASDRGVPTVQWWTSLSTDARFKQLNWGRFAGQLYSLMTARMRQFLEVPLDPITFSQLEAAIRADFNALRRARALYAPTDDLDGFNLLVQEVNTETTIANRELHAEAEVSMSALTEAVVIGVATSIATEI